jgi:hypothetical protein
MQKDNLGFFFLQSRTRKIVPLACGCGHLTSDGTSSRLATGWTHDRHGITQNPAKFQFAKDMVVFTRLEITPTSIQPLDNWNKSDIHLLFSLIRQVSYSQSS